MTISERAAYQIKPRAVMVTCPCCEHTFNAAKVGKPRSPEQNRRFWAVVRAFFDHWPETNARQFSSENELRIWAQMKAGYRDIAARIPLVGIQRERGLMLVEAGLRAAKSNAVPVIHKDEMVIFTPRSISFASLPHGKACEVLSAVETLLENESGLKAEELLRERA